MRGRLARKLWRKLQLRPNWEPRGTTADRMMAAEKGAARALDWRFKHGSRCKLQATHVWFLADSGWICQGCKERSRELLSQSMSTKVSVRMSRWWISVSCDACLLAIKARRKGYVAIGMRAPLKARRTGGSHA